MTPATVRQTWIGAIAVPLWATLAPLAVLSGTLPPFLLIGLSFFAAFIIATSISQLRGKRLIDQVRQPWRAWLVSVGGLFIYHAFYFGALKSAPPVEANLINYLWPLLIVLFSALLPGEKLKGRHLLGVGMGFGGAILVVTKGQSLNLAGDSMGYLLGVGAAVSWATYSVLNRRFAHVPSEALGPVLGVVAVLALTAHWVFEPPASPSGLTGWLVILGMGLGPLGAAFFFWDFGTKRGDIQVLGTLAYATPLLSTAILLGMGLGDFTWSLGLGAGLIAGGAWVAARR